MGKYFLKYPKKNVSTARMLRKQMIPAEKKLWDLLRGNQLGVHFRRQVPFGRYVADFLAVKPRIVVELDGIQHSTREGKKKDEERDAYLRDNGLTVLRYSNDDVLENADGVLEEIFENVQERLPKVTTPLSSRRGEG